MEAGFFVYPCTTEESSELDNERQSNCERTEDDVLMMSDSTKRIEAQGSRGFPPVDSVHRWRNRAPRRFETLFHFKGFAGGVPLNTERTTVKPWVGIAR